MSEEKVLCDNCHIDLTECGPREDYRLVLKSERIPVVTVYTVDCIVHAPIEEDLYFCGLGCLRNWVKNNVCVEEGE